MGKPKNGTICSKHDKIYDLANEIQDLVGKCLEDGQNMERGLEEKRERINELEAEVRDLQKDLDLANSRIDAMEKEIEVLESRITDIEVDR